MKAIAGKTTISQTRANLEAAMSADPDRKWTTTQVRKEICDVPHAANYLNSLCASGQARIIGTNKIGHNEYVWHTSKLLHKAERGSDVAGPRIYVNGSMPNGDAAYWKRAMAWGR